VRIAKWLLVSCAAFLVVAYAMTRPLGDFVEYWAAAHQLLAGRSPYSFTESLQLERALGWSKSLPIVALNPPWALPLMAPLGLAKSYALAWIVWVGTLTFVVWLSTKSLLGLYSGGGRLFPSETAASERILAFTFYPTLLCIGTAQITPFVLLGVTGFLFFVTRKSYAFAGACLALAAIKPQLVYLLWLALVLWCWRERKWRPVLSLAAAIASLTGFALLIRPRLLADYWQFSHSGYVKIWPSALGAILRYPFDSVRSFPLQFVAPAFGAAWFLFYWRRHGESWDWKECMPLVIAVSVLTAPYGWTLDQVLLLVPVIAIVARYVRSDQGELPRRIVWAYTALNIAIILGSLRGPAVAYVLAPLAMALILVRTSPGGDSSPLPAVDSIGVTS